MSSILVSLDGGVLSITLNRPDKLNAFNPEMHQLLKAAFERARDESAVRALLLTGAGRAFCAGQDLSERNVSPGAAPIDLSISLGSNYNPPVRRCLHHPNPHAYSLDSASAADGANTTPACHVRHATPTLS